MRSKRLTTRTHSRHEHVLLLSHSISFSEPIAAAELTAGPGEQVTMQPIIERARALLETHMGV